MALILFLAIALNVLACEFVHSHSIEIPHEEKFEKRAAEVSLIESRSISESPQNFELKVRAFGQTFHLKNLKRPENSIFSDGFTFGGAAVDPAVLKEAERDIYVDHETKSAIHVARHEDGNHQINGVVNGHGIRHEDGIHYVVRNAMPSDQNCHTKAGMRPHDHDVNSTALPFIPEARAAGPLATIEIQVILDGTLGRLLNSVANMTRYAGIMFHSSNTVFAELKDPKVQLKVAGIYPLSTSESAQIVDKNPDDNLNQLTNLTAWYKKSPPGVGGGDVVVLLSGVQGGSGIAYRGGACNPSWKTAVIQDFGAFWYGTTTLTHEVGHSLGAEHDFEVACGEQGFIMGYRPGTANYFHWSPCSQQQIREQATGPNGQCYYTTDAKAPVQQGTSDPGDDPKLTFDFQCKKVVQERRKVSTGRYREEDNPVATACSANLRCFYSEPDGRAYITEIGEPALEGTKCKRPGQTNGRCNLGRCV